jgi:SEC-C motif-containing protein
MRSRYSAYAIKDADYIIATTHPENPIYSSNHEDWKTSILYFCNHTSFHNLKIIEILEGVQESYITFFAHLFEKDKDVSFEETSRFVKVDDRWYYHSKQ